MGSLENHRRWCAATYAALIRRVLVAAINDTSALGAVRAFEGAGRRSFCAVLGHNVSMEARAEMRRPETRLVGSVAFFPEKYGERLMKLARDILLRQAGSTGSVYGARGHHA